MLANNARMSDTVRIDHCYSDGNGNWDGSTVMLDMKDYDGCMFIIGATTVAPSATNCIAAVRVISNTTAAGAGTDHEIAEAVTTDGGTTKTLVAADMGTAAVTTFTNQNFIVMDVKASQMYAGDRYIGIMLTETGTFPTHTVALRYNGSFNFKDMFQTTRTAFQYDGDL